MRGVLADNNIQGQVEQLCHYFESTEWHDIWIGLNLVVYTFADVGLRADALDTDIWQTCQDQQLVLITANRNDQGPDSLEAAIRTRNTPTSLPVITLADSERVRQSGAYAKRAAEKTLEYLFDINKRLGAGRLYVP